MCFQILHTSGQIEILCDALRDICPEKKNQHLVFSMKELIGKHQKIIVFSDKIERIFCYLALIQFLSSTLLTCCIGFTIVTVSNCLPRIERNNVSFVAVTIYIAIRCCSRSAGRRTQIQSIARH